MHNEVIINLQVVITIMKNVMIIKEEKWKGERL